jgi:glycosyltransferase involved in cell wall biosynthesis
MRIAILDSYFNWPPSGGGIRAIKEVASGLAKRGYEPILIIPEYVSRGVVTGNLNFEIQKLKFNKFDFTGFNLYRRIKSVLSDVVLVGNGNLLKPYMILASRKYPVIVRLYSYEFLCPLYYGLLFKDNHVCSSNYITSPHKCIPCMFNKKYIAKLNFEAIRSCSFLFPLYHRITKESLKIPKKFILTSDYMKRRYSEIIPAEKLKIVPHGVATDKFKPYESEKSCREIKLIFFPSRPNDPLKGLNALINAANILWKQRRDFRILVTGNTNINIEKHPFIICEGWKSGNGCT